VEGVKVEKVSGVRAGAKLEKQFITSLWRNLKGISPKRYIENFGIAIKSAFVC
jgi:hypothetical protein